MASIILADPPKSGGERGGNGNQHQSAQAPVVVQQPKTLPQQQSQACPDTHQRQYDCNTVSAIANVKQADAAIYFNKLALVEIGVGLFTAAVAFFAMRFAKHAADAAREALSHERTRSAAELRPWVKVDLSVSKFVCNGDRIAIGYQVAFTNIGQTIAEHFAFKMETAYVAALDTAAKLIDEAYAAWMEPTDRTETFALMPGETRSFDGAHSMLKSHLPWRKGGKQTSAVFYVIATAFYWSAMDEKWHRTDRAFTVGRKDDSGSSTAGLFIYKDDVVEGEKFSVVKPGMAGKTT